MGVQESETEDEKQQGLLFLVWDPELQDGGQGNQEDDKVGDNAGRPREIPHGNLRDALSGHRGHDDGDWEAGDTEKDDADDHEEWYKQGRHPVAEAQRPLPSQEPPVLQEERQLDDVQRDIVEDDDDVEPLIHAC